MIPDAAIFGHAAAAPPGAMPRGSSQRPRCDTTRGTDNSSGDSRCRDTDMVYRPGTLSNDVVAPPIGAICHGRDWR
jgi:hypothetical protein